MAETVEEVGMHRRSAGVADDAAVPGPDGAAVTSRPDGAAASRRRGLAVPRRMCVVCRETTAKRALHRIVRSPGGAVAYDPTGKAAGRGAYLCGRPACLDTAIRRRSIQRALKVTDTEAVNAAVEALRTQVWSGSADQPAPRSSDDEEVRSG
jgi:predicted RNA-binding protein YlxR (DUF448 family)